MEFFLSALATFQAVIDPLTKLAWVPWQTLSNHSSRMEHHNLDRLLSSKPSSITVMDFTCLSDYSVWGTVHSQGEP